jgi:hypothetical protein
MSAPAVRFDIDSEDLARGFAQVVLGLAEVVRELLERQAIRRMSAGDLSDVQIERLGMTLLRIRDELEALRTALTGQRATTRERDLS